MLGIFRTKNSKDTPKLVDINNNELQIGDTVISHRYDLGECVIIDEGGEYYYQSVETGKKMNWLRMIDAVTERQKVEKKISGTKI